MTDTTELSPSRMLEPLTTAGWWPVSRDLYHADTSRVNHSALKVFSTSPELYRGRFVTGEYPHPEPKPVMVLGSATHCCVLEDNLDACYAVAPDGLDRRTKAGKEAWSEFETSCNGRTIISTDDHKRVLAMREGVKRNQMVWDWLSRPGHTEGPIVWTDADTGLPCKALLDRLSGSVIIDLKTATDPYIDDWAKQVVRFAYHRQAAWYLDGVTAALGIPDPLFVHVVVGSQEPHDCFAYELDDAALSLGRRQNREALARLRECLETNTWNVPGMNELTRISLPPWAWAGE